MGRACDSVEDDEDDGGRPLDFIRNREVGHLDVAM